MMRSLSLAAALAFAASPLRAEPFAFDPTHTQVTFAVDHFGFSTTYGQFRAMTGSLDLDRERPEASKVSFTIETASIDTGFDKRDAHLRTADFLDVAKHPTMTFVSTKVERTGEGAAKVTGDLTLKGVTKPVTLDVTMNKLAPSPITNKMTVGLTATGILKRTEFGVSTYAPAVGDEVRITISAEAAVAS